MEFRYRAGDQIPPPLGSFVPPLQRGIMVPVPELRAPPLGLLRELQKERIREEIIAREILAEHNILEEEVRWEMAIECTMGIRRIPVADSLMLTSRSQDFIAQRLHPQSVTMEKRLPFRVDPSDVVEEESGLDRRVLDREVAEVEEELGLDRRVLDREVAEVPRVEEQASPKVSGVKRKDNASANKMWGCALCHVIATYEGQLDVHLQGKKHKRKTRLLGGLKKNTKSEEGEDEDEVDEGEEMEELMVNGTMHRVVQRNKFYVCKPCRIECNSQRMMATHITSKRHVTWMGKCRSSSGGGGKRAKQSMSIPEDALKDEKSDAGDNNKLEARNGDSDSCVDTIH